MVIHNSYKLRFTVFLVLTLFLLLVTVSGLQQIRTLNITEQNVRAVGSVSKLEETTQSIVSSSINYDANAPRDYESYNRDVVIFLFEIESDFANISKDVSELQAQLEGQVRPVVPGLLSWLTSDEPYQQLSQSFADVSTSWDEIQATYREKLGEDEDEPRLEWGAEYLAESIPGFGEQVMLMGKHFRAFLDQQSANSASMMKIGLLVLIAIGVIGLIWFYLSVIRRIGETADACVRVANGDFGYTLKVSGRDELAILSRSFNLVSSRSQLTVKLLTQLQQAGTIEEGLAAVIQASGSYLPVAWTGLLRVSRDDSSRPVIDLVSTLPPSSLDGWSSRSISVDSDMGKTMSDALISRTPILVDRLRDLALKDNPESFFQDLARTTQIESLVMVPMNSEQGWQGYLLFGSKSTAYRNDQVELLKNLSAPLASSFQRIVG